MSAKSQKTFLLQRNIENDADKKLQKKNIFVHMFYGFSPSLIIKSKKS